MKGTIQERKVTDGGREGHLIECGPAGSLSSGEDGHEEGRLNHRNRSGSRPYVFGGGGEGLGVAGSM